MKTRLPLVAALVVACAGPLQAEKIPAEFRAPFEQKFWAGKTYAVVLQKGLPTMSICGVRGDSTNAHCWIDVIGENWKASEGLLDFDQTDVAYLDLGEVMELNSLSWKDNRVDLKLISVESKKVTRGSGFLRSTKREPVSTNFKFFFPFPKSKVMTAADVPVGLEFIQLYLQPFPTEAQARVYAAEIVAGGARPATAPAAPPPASPRDHAAAPPPPPNKRAKLGDGALAG